MKKNTLNQVYKKNTLNNISIINIFYSLDMSCDKKLPGLGSFTSKMLVKGSKKFDARSLALELEKNAISFEINRTNKYLNFCLMFDNRKLNKASELFFEILENPIFPDVEIERLKKDFLNEITSRNDYIFNVCFDKFLQNLYGEKNPKSLFTLGNSNSIKNITKKDLRLFHKNFLLSRPKTVSIISSLDQNVFEDKFLKNLKKYHEMQNSTETFKTKNDTQIFCEIKSDFNQAYLIHGLKVPSIRHEKFVGLKLINRYLGVGMSSLFFEKIREDLGLVYEIGSSHSNYDDENYWFTRMGLDKKNIKKALDTLDFELQKLCKNKIKSGDIKILKEQLKMAEILKNQKQYDQCFLLGFYDFLDLGADYQKKYLDAIEKISKKEIDEAIDILFSDKKFYTVVVK